MNGNLGRVDGGMGFSIDNPKLEFEIKKNDQFSIINKDYVNSELSSKLLTVLTEIAHQYKTNGVEITLIDTIPEHSGFGSKTATLLSVIYAFGKLYDLNLDMCQIAQQVKRGGTSGLGINLIDKGGFILEGGHSTKYKKEFIPSSAAKTVTLAPILARYAMPDWNVLVALPKTVHMYGQKEIEFFQKICPVPRTDVEKSARITLSQILPAICEGDRYTFCKGINSLQDRVWKKNEITIYGSSVVDTIKKLHRLGAEGIGMSSIGPAVYAFGDNLEDIALRLEKNSDIEYSFIYITKPNNFGMRIETK